MTDPPPIGVALIVKFVISAHAGQRSRHVVMDASTTKRLHRGVVCAVLLS